MKIQYDKDFEKVMNELQANFGWSNIDVLPDSYKDLLNDTIKAVKNCSIPAVAGRSKQLSVSFQVGEKVLLDGHTEVEVLIAEPKLYIRQNESDSEMWVNTERLKKKNL